MAPLSPRRALESLIARTNAPTEILVVDNAPSDEATCRVVQEAFPSVPYTREPVMGAGHGHAGVWQMSSPAPAPVTRGTFAALVLLGRRQPSER